MIDTGRILDLIHEKEEVTYTLRKSLTVLRAIYEETSEIKNTLAETIPEMERVLLSKGEDTVIRMLKDEDAKDNTQR